MTETAAAALIINKGFDAYFRAICEKKIIKYRLVCCLGQNNVFTREIINFLERKKDFTKADVTFTQ